MEDLTREEKRKKAEALNNSRPLDVWHVSDYPEVKTALDQIFSEMQANGLTNKRYEKKLRDHIRAIVLDLYVAHESDQTMYVSYSRTANDYDQKSRYSALFLGFRNTVKVIDFLVDQGYVEEVRGFHWMKYPERSRQSRIRATAKLIELVRDTNEITFPMIKRDEDEEVIVLRDANGNDIDYTNTDETKRMRENLKLINKALEKHSILLEVKDTELEALRKRLRKGPEKKAIDFSQKRLRRIFNVSFKRGGRFYGGWWENIPRDYRQYIRIDRKDTVELDYSGLHINMLYAMEGLPMPEGDVYGLDGYPMRKGSPMRAFLKQMVLVMVNSISREGTRKALHKEVHYKKTLKLPLQIKSTKGQDLFPLMDAFQKKHEGIKHYFNSGKGIDLQYLDSQLAEKVLLHFSKMGYAILPMHDSFILHHGLEGELDEAMKEAFYELFGQQIKVGLKYRSIEERWKENKRKKKRQEKEDTWGKKVQRRLDRLDGPLTLISPTLKKELREILCPEVEDPGSDKDKEALIGAALRAAELKMQSKIVAIESAAREQEGRSVMKEINALIEAYGQIKDRLENPKDWDFFYEVPVGVYLAERKEYGTYERLLDQHFALQSKPK